MIHFESFELDLETAEVRTDGRIMRLPEQQFQILGCARRRIKNVVSAALQNEKTIRIGFAVVLA